MSKVYDFTVICDGGCEPNPGKMYGSWQVIDRQGNKSGGSQKFGSGTNNVAEYRSLILALESIVAKLEKSGLSPAAFMVRCWSDSKLIVNQLNGDWAIRDSKLRELNLETTTLLKKFKNWRIDWQPREETVKVLGH